MQRLRCVGNTPVAYRIARPAMWCRVGPVKLIYVADPMCSWCWGFSPVIRAVAECFDDRLPIDVVMGGLRPGIEASMSEAMKTDIRAHWVHVHEASGQPFDHAFFDRDAFVYDTEPACRAVVTARTQSAGSELDMLSAVQAAFYRDNRDVTATATLAEIAEATGLDRRAFVRNFDAERTRAATRSDFSRTASLGVRGFPTLIGDDGDGLVALAVGFQTAERLLPTIDAWARGREGAAGPD